MLCTLMDACANKLEMLLMFETICLPQNNRWSIVPLDTQTRSFFKYEKRIREMSTREKVFEYFASLKSQGRQSVMSPSDVMRSLVPVYPRKTGENSQVTCAMGLCQDVDKELSLLSSQEYFSFHEWLLIEALISVPEDEINVAFAMLDSDDNGEIDKNEFLQLIASFVDKERIMPSSDDIFCSRLVKILFGEDLRQTLTLQSLELFVKRLRSDIIHLEFDYYDVDKKVRLDNSGNTLGTFDLLSSDFGSEGSNYWRVSSP